MQKVRSPWRRGTGLSRCLPGARQGPRPAPLRTGALSRVYCEVARGPRRPRAGRARVSEARPQQAGEAWGLGPPDRTPRAKPPRRRVLIPRARKCPALSALSATLCACSGRAQNGSQRSDSSPEALHNLQAQLHPKIGWSLRRLGANSTKS